MQKITKNQLSFQPWLFPHPAAWASILVVMSIALIWANHVGFVFKLKSNILFSTGMITALLVAWTCHRASQRWPAKRKFLIFVASAIITTLFVITQGMAITMVQYLGMAEKFPLIDPWLAQMDAMLGLDWPSHVKWVNNHPAVLSILYQCYDSINTTMVFTFAGLLLLERFDRVKELLILFWSTGLITIIIAILFPAIAAYAYYDLPAADIANIPPESGRYHLEHLLALRDGSMRSLTFGNQTGMVEFPSFHTILAILSTWALRRTIIFWPIALLNLGMIMSTIAHGGHYFVDVFAGFALAGIVIAIYHSIVALNRRFVLDKQHTQTGSRIPQWQTNMTMDSTNTPPTTSH